MQSLEWKTLREQVIKRDKMCRICGSSADLQVHHIPKSYKQLGQENPDDLLTVCGLCHDIITSELRRREFASQSIITSTKIQRQEGVNLKHTNEIEQKKDEKLMLLVRQKKNTCGITQVI